MLFHVQVVSGHISEVLLSHGPSNSKKAPLSLLNMVQDVLSPLNNQTLAKTENSQSHEHVWTTEMLNSSVSYDVPLFYAIVCMKKIHSNIYVPL